MRIPSPETQIVHIPLIRATDGLVDRCWTSNLGHLAGASSNPAMILYFSNQNEVIDFVFVAERRNFVLTHYGLIVT